MCSNKVASLRDSGAKGGAPETETVAQGKIN